MARLLRPHIPISVRLEVALRQLRLLRLSVDRDSGEADSAYLPRVLGLLSARLGGVLQLDHDPALEFRGHIMDRNYNHVGYHPDANDPEHLIYRTVDNHRTKTFVSGDHGQYCDTILAARERNRKRKANPASPERKLRGGNRWPPRGSRSFNRRQEKKNV